MNTTWWDHVEQIVNVEKKYVSFKGRASWHHGHVMVSTKMTIKHRGMENNESMFIEW